MTVGLGALSISKDFTHWINDGLMAVFFLVVGLEIKREMLVGELFSLWGAALPMAAALGGAVAPSRMTDSNALPAVPGAGGPLVS